MILSNPAIRQFTLTKPCEENQRRNCFISSILGDMYACRHGNNIYAVPKLRPDEADAPNDLVPKPTGYATPSRPQSIHNPDQARRLPAPPMVLVAGQRLLRL